MPTYGYIHFICLIQIQNTERYTVYRKSAKKYRDINFCSYRPALFKITFFKFYILKIIFSCDGETMTPLYSVTWFFENQSAE